MITPYLKSLAATVRDLVASGKAVHVTNETAAELDLLAGLPWDAAERACAEINQTPSPVSATPVNPITPADLALGWLLASRAQPEEDYIEGPNDVVRIERILDGGAKRAAECAELAVMAARVAPEVRQVSAERMAEDRKQVQVALLQSFGMGTLQLMPSPLEDLQVLGIDPHDGTREGARAAWGFVVEQMTRSAESLNDYMRKPDANIDRNVGRRFLCADRYRRELEAM